MNLHAVNKSNATSTPFPQMMPTNSGDGYVGDERRQVFFGDIPVDVKHAEVPNIPKPPYSYVALIVLAVDGLGGKATLSQIYKFIEAKFDYYRLVAKRRGWQNSIRHNLSLNRNCFMKVSRDGITAPDGRKGNYWSLRPGISLMSLFEEGNCKRRRRIGDCPDRKVQKQTSRRPRKKTRTAEAASSQAGTALGWGPTLHSEWCLQQFMQGKPLAKGEGAGERQFAFPWEQLDGNSHGIEGRPMAESSTAANETPRSSTHIQTPAEAAMALIRELGVPPAPHHSPHRGVVSRTWSSGSDQSLAYVSGHLFSPLQTETHNTMSHGSYSSSDWEKFQGLAFPHSLDQAARDSGIGLGNQEDSSSHRIGPSSGGSSFSNRVDLPTFTSTFPPVKSEPSITHTPSRPTCPHGDQPSTPQVQAEASHRQPMSVNQLWRSFEIAGCFSPLQLGNSSPFTQCSPNQVNLQLNASPFPPPLFNGNGVGWSPVGLVSRPSFSGMSTAACSHLVADRCGSLLNSNNAMDFDFNPTLGPSHLPG